MREKQLSKRLQAVADMVTPGLRVADVGCDHAYVSIYLTERGIAGECFALDVRKGPLMRAEKNIAAHRLSERIHTRLGSGLTPMQPGEIDAVLMAGMGGILVRDLLEESRELSHSLKEWVLQPQSDVDLVRRYIRESGFQITEENMVLEDGKYYPMFRAVPGEKMAETAKTETAKAESPALSERAEEFLSAKELEPGEMPELKKAVPEAEATAIKREALKQEALKQEVWDRFGEHLLRQRHPVLREYLKERNGHYERVLSQMRKNASAAKRSCELSGAERGNEPAAGKSGKQEAALIQTPSVQLEERIRLIEREAECVRLALRYYEISFL